MKAVYFHESCILPKAHNNFKTNKKYFSCNIAFLCNKLVNQNMYAFLAIYDISYN